MYMQCTGLGADHPLSPSSDCHQLDNTMYMQSSKFGVSQPFSSSIDHDQHHSTPYAQCAWRDVDNPLTSGSERHQLDNPMYMQCANFYMDQKSPLKYHCFQCHFTDNVVRYVSLHTCYY